MPRPIQLISSRVLAWLQCCGIAFILAGIALAQGAATWQFFRQALAKPEAHLILLGAVAHFVFSVAMIAVFRFVYRRQGPSRFLWMAILASVLVQAAAIWASNENWSWTNDAQIFQYYVDTLSANGYSADTLGDLSQYYDYRVWTRRAPIYLAIRNLAGSEFVRAVQWFQVGLVALSLAIAWRIALLLFGRRVAFWATCLQWLMPFRWFACLDLNHHLLGGSYYLVGLWILAEWFRGKPSVLRQWGIAICASVLLPLMKLEGGIDLVYGASVAWVVLACGIAEKRGFRRTLGSALILLGLPVLASSCVLSPLAKTIARADLHRHESGAIAFMARGWSPETGGEYAATYETLDYLTPAERKKPVQLSILASQGYYNPKAILFRLLPVKMAKYFLLGYSAGAEEMLQANSALVSKALASGARSAFLLAVLPLVFLGGILVLPSLSKTRRLVLVLPCAAICVTYVLLGETSPRYSIYIQPFLFMLGALPLAWPWRRHLRLAQAARVPGTWAFASLSLALLAATFALFMARPFLRRHVFADMRQWTAPGSPLSSTLAPLELRLDPSDAAEGTAWGPANLPPAPPSRGMLSFYLLSDAPPHLARQTVVEVESINGNSVLLQTNSLPARILLPYSAGTRGRLQVRTASRFPFPLRIGYATYEPSE